MTPRQPGLCSVQIRDLHPSAARRWWIGTALAAVAVLTSSGMFSAFGLMGRIVVF